MTKASLRNALVPVEVVLGGTELTVDEMSRLAEGSIIQLRSVAGEPVELRAGGTAIAQGEVVVIDENFGIRITSVPTDDTASEE